jgi:hypothetical protein
VIAHIIDGENEEVTAHALAEASADATHLGGPRLASLEHGAELETAHPPSGSRVGESVPFAPRDRSRE